MARLCGVGVLLLAGVLAGCTSDLDRQIVAEREGIATLSGEIEQATPEGLKVAHEVLAELRYRPIQSWLTQVSSPEFSITMAGIDGSRRGDVVYIPGHARVRIEPERDTVGAISLRGIHLDGNNSGLSWQGSVGAGLRSQFRYSIEGVRDKIPCRARMDPRGITGSLSLRPPQGTNIPYEMTFAIPGSIEVPVSCHMVGPITVN